VLATFRELVLVFIDTWALERKGGGKADLEAYV
jgi:hypothetical protein